MKKVILLMIFMVLLSSFVLGASVNRVVSDFTVSYTVSGASGRFGGIITENLPSNYGFGTFLAGLDYKINGRTLEIPFTSTSLPRYTLFGAGVGTLSGSYEFADNLGSGSIGGANSIGSVTATTLPGQTTTTTIPGDNTGGSGFDFGSLFKFDMDNFPSGIGYGWWGLLVVVVLLVMKK